jgi:hypothetical protein
MKEEVTFYRIPYSVGGKGKKNDTEDGFKKLLRIVGTSLPYYTAHVPEHILMLLDVRMAKLRILCTE